jgi:hypothetical protein
MILWGRNISHSIWLNKSINRSTAQGERKKLDNRHQVPVWVSASKSSETGRCHGTAVRLYMWHCSTGEASISIA